MDRNWAIARIKLLTGCNDTDLISALYDDACEQVCAYTGRTHVPAALEKTTRDIAIMAYNRNGTEGEASRSAAGESYTFDDLPESIRQVLNRHRLARVGGETIEAQNSTG